MVIYNPAQHEQLALMWYKMLADENELAATFYPSMHNLTGFLSNWANSSSVLLIDGDETGPGVCVWFEPMMDGAWCGAWIRKDLRSGMLAMKFIINAFGRALEKWPVLLAWTIQPEVISYLKRLGFKHKANLPNLFGGKSVAVCSVERSDLRLYHPNMVE